MHREKGVHSMGYVGVSEVGMSVPMVWGVPRTLGVHRSLCMGAGGTWHELGVCRKVSLPV